VAPMLLASMPHAPKRHHAQLKRMFAQGSRPLRRHAGPGVRDSDVPAMDRGLQGALQMTRTSHPMMRGPPPGVRHIQCNSRTHVPQKLTGFISLVSHPLQPT
jgi:hypothetical protein